MKQDLLAYREEKRNKFKGLILELAARCNIARSIAVLQNNIVEKAFRL